MSGIWKAIAEFLSLTNWFVRRRAARKDNPENKQADWQKEVDREIEKDDEAAANVRINDALARIRMRQHGKDHPGRSGD